MNVSMVEVCKAPTTLKARKNIARSATLGIEEKMADRRRDLIGYIFCRSLPIYNDTFSIVGLTRYFTSTYNPRDHKSVGFGCLPEISL